MNPARRLGLAAGLLACVAVAPIPSCAVSGTPDPELGVPFREPMAKRLSNAGAARETMLLEAGTPYYASADGRRIAYVSVWHRQTHHIWLGVLLLEPQLMDSTSNSTRTHVVLVEFDADDTARRSTSFSMYQTAPTDEELKQRIREWFADDAES